MNTSPVSNSNPRRPFLVRLYARGLVIPVMIGIIWFGYYAANTLGVPEQTGTAQVVSKQIVEPGSDYYTTIVGGHFYVQAHPANAAYLVELQLDGERVGSFVSESMYGAITAGDTLDVRYRQTRLGGQTQMVEIIESSLKKG